MHVETNTKPGHARHPSRALNRTALDQVRA
jgi:hypothetical protein